jgi:hypothetical protein
MAFPGKKDFKTMADEIEQQTDMLIKEFFDHYEQLKNTGTEKIDQRTAFEGWIIQKVAGLQVLLKELNNEIKLLQN